MAFKYPNQILKINLTNQSVTTERINPDSYRLVLGGKGIGVWLLYRDLPPRTEPLAPDNLLIFTVGPLTGTAAPTSGRCGVVTKGPATGGLLDSYCGGNLGQQIRYAGYDAVVISGRAPSLTTLIITDEKVSFESAERLKDLNTRETTNRLKQQLGNDYTTAVIGPAGERKAPIAGIFSDWRCFGRGGAGAVMGSKNLKAIALKGTKTVQVAQPDKFQKMVWIANRCLRMSITISRLKAEGTPNILELINVFGGLPTRNFKLGQFKQAETIYGSSWSKEVWTKNTACFNCPIACTKVAAVKNSSYGDFEIDGPEYETLFALGPNCGLANKEAILYANYLCDLYGVDTISVGVIIAYVMELFEKGYLAAKDLDGLKPHWGDAQAFVALVEKIGRAEGCGAWLQAGVKSISERFPQAAAFAMHAKGLELPGYLPNAAKGIGLGYAISERGGCHLHGAPLSELLGGADPLKTANKAALTKITQAETQVINSAVLCFFVMFGMSLKEVYAMINTATDFDYASPKDLTKVGERIITLSRLFNLREGLQRKDDTLPGRCLQEPLAAGPAKGHTVDLEPMLDEYYNLMGWDQQGVPTQELITKLFNQGGIYGQTDFIKRNPAQR
ncbi:aldehyde ferredoxin oxidoreductase family protein [Planctomycetota bacterium]